MIDFHSHILPGIDDGAISTDESIAMARLLRDFGYKTVCCTPHCIRTFYDLSPEKVREAVLMLQADLDNADIDLELWPGMEYMLDEHLSDYADQLQPLGETRLVLCEAPQQAHPQIVQQNLELIIEKGFVPLIAHPERTQYFYDVLCSFRNAERGTGDGVKGTGNRGRGTWDEEKPSGTKSLLQRLWPFASRATRPSSLASSSASPVPRPSSLNSCLFQANLGSFTGYYGAQVQHRAYDLLKRGVYTALASDLHDSSSAAKIMSGDKLSSNPLLQGIAAFDGSIPAHLTARDNSGPVGQGDLFG